MKAAFTTVALGLLLVGCGRRDAHLQKEVIGNWGQSSYFKMTLSPDGSVVSRWATRDKSLIYQGTWKIQGGSMVFTITNLTAQGYTNFERVGSVERYAIIRADSTGLIYSNNNQVISLIRK
jgi:hypothetical protein